MSGVSPALKPDDFSKTTNSNYAFSGGAKFSFGLLAENKKTTDGSDIKIYCFRLLFCAYHEDYLSAKKIIKIFMRFHTLE